MVICLGLLLIVYYYNLVNIFLFDVHQKLALSVSFCVGKVDFLALVRQNFTFAAKYTFRTQNDTDSANFRYTANKKYRSYHVLNVF